MEIYNFSGSCKDLKGIEEELNTAFNSPDILGVYGHCPHPHFISRGRQWKLRLGVLFVGGQTFPWLWSFFCLPLSLSLNASSAWLPPNPSPTGSLRVRQAREGLPIVLSLGPKLKLMTSWNEQ